MALFDDYNVNLDDFEAPSYEVADGFHQFEVGDCVLREGTEKKPDAVWLIITYLLGDNGTKKDEWFQLPADPSNPDNKEAIKMGFLKARLKDLGFEGNLNTLQREQLIGITGVLETFTKNGYQNIRKVKADGAPAASPIAAKAPAHAAAGAAVPANPFEGI